MREGVGDIRRVTLLITLGGELTHMRGGDPDTGGDMGHIKGGAGANSQSINRGYTFICILLMMSRTWGPWTPGEIWVTSREVPGRDNQYTEDIHFNVYNNLVVLW